MGIFCIVTVDAICHIPMHDGANFEMIRILPVKNTYFILLNFATVVDNCQSVIAWASISKFDSGTIPNAVDTHRFSACPVWRWTLGNTTLTCSNNLNQRDTKKSFMKSLKGNQQEIRKIDNYKSSHCMMCFLDMHVYAGFH